MKINIYKTTTMYDKLKEALEKQYMPYVVKMVPYDSVVILVGTVL